MGRQVPLYTLPEDRRAFLEFVRQRDPVVIALASANSPEIAPLSDPHEETRITILWDQSLLRSLARKHIPALGADAYTVDMSLPIVEFSPSRLCEWNGRPGLIQGRIYGSFDNPVPGYEKWFNALARWLRTRFTRNPGRPGGYLGPAAYDWHRKGGVLLPTFAPPLTPEWLSWVAAQDERRAGHSR